jgi:V/A-type H+-transporting ATPase subunit K
MVIEQAAAIAAFGAGTAIVGGAIGTAWAQSAIGAAGMGVIAERPESVGQVLLLVALPETVLIFSFVVAVLILLGAGLI